MNIFTYLAMLVYGTELTPFTLMVLIPHGFRRQNNLFLLSKTSKNKLLKTWDERVVQLSYPVFDSLSFTYVMRGKADTHYLQDPRLSVRSFPLRYLLLPVMLSTTVVRRKRKCSVH